MHSAANHPTAYVALNDRTLCASLELSHKTWVLTVLSPGTQKISKFSTAAGNGDALIELLGRLQSRVEAAVEGPVGISVVQEAGLDGFWVHRLLEARGIKSHVVDPASIAVPRRQRRAKTDVIDGETLLRTLLAWRRGEPRVCAMVVPPSPDQEDRRRICRERAILLRERIRHVNRVKGLLSGQGIVDYEPLERDRRARLDELITGDGRPLPPRLKAELLREIEIIELLLRQISDVEAERDADARSDVTDQPSPVATLMRLKAVGPQLAATLHVEGLFRHFTNRREVAAYAGLVPTPWRRRKYCREQGISKAGNRRLRTAMIELAWLWVRHQSESAFEPLVPRACRRGARQAKADRDRRPRTQAADRALALRDAGRSTGGSDIEVCVKS